ncbi:hypothetical protein GQR58_025779 [Nymphon striatum]|nr:hypothetical protein GQR58_025779 [Nymphon striatum]
MEIIKNIFGGKLMLGRISSIGLDLELHLRNNWSLIENFIEENALEGHEQSVDIAVKIRMRRFEGGEWSYTEFYRHTGYISTNEDALVEIAVKRLVTALEDFIENGSGWELACISFIDVTLNNFNILMRRQVIGHGDVIDLPKALKNKHAVYNLENTNGKCFLYSLLCVLKHASVKAKHDARSYNQFLDIFDVSGIDFPFNLGSFNRFHVLNKKYAINIFEYLKDEVKILRRPSLRQYDGRTVINILFITIKGKGHFLPIINFNRLMNSRMRDGKRTRQRFYCHKCLFSFITNTNLQLHINKCYFTNEKVLKPPKDPKFFFKNYSKTMEPSHILFADFECIITDEGEHLPIAAGYIRWSNYENYTYESYCGLDCVSWFVKQIKAEMTYVKMWYECNSIKLHGLNKEERKKLITDSPYCYMCKKNVNLTNAVLDHCHLTGNLRGVCCVKCNSTLKLSRNSLKIVIHNLRGYDGHLLMKFGLSKEQNCSISVIAHSSEKYLTFSVMFFGQENFRLQFIDSYQHLSASLSVLFESLKKDEAKITNDLKNIYPLLTDEVIMKKGTFCYEYLNSENKLSEKQLPTRDMFYNRLINEECSHANYDIAKKAWFQFDCDSLKDYLMGYLRMDVYQLADIFINYTNMCKNYYGLYPVNYVSLPGLSLDAALKSSNIMLDLITDRQMLLDFKTSIRGGLVFLNKHHSIANIPKTEGYDPKSPQKQIIVVDENNLYGFSMQNYLPKGNFKYINEFDFNNVDEKYGYFFVVDLAYPSKIHDLTCDFPLASEHMKITDDMLSDYMKNLPIKKGAPTQKLTLNQFDKIEYKVFYPVLKFYLEMGMKITKIHRIIKYDQEPFLKSYIDFNSRMRQNSTTDFGKSFFKLLNNSVFGKLCENLTNRTNFKLCTNETQLAKVLAHPQIKQSYFFDDNLTGHSIDITEVEMNRPLAIGSCILDLSKLIMYDLFYKKLKPIFPNIRILASDTDSFFLEIHNMSHDKIIKTMWPILDTSNYDKNHKYFSLTNKAKLGYIKDEGCGSPFLEAVFLKPKMYSLLSTDDKYNKKTAKEVLNYYLSKVDVNFQNCTTLKRNVLDDDYDGLWLHLVFLILFLIGVAYAVYFHKFLKRNEKLIDL